MTTPQAVTCNSNDPSKDAVPCDACFQSFPNNTIITYNGGDSEILTCKAAISGATAPAACSGLTSDSSLGRHCQSVCAFSSGNYGTNIAACYVGTEGYCRANPDNYDCTCLQAAGKSWPTTNSTPVSYDQLEGYVAQNPGLNFDARCLFPACSSVLASAVVQDPSLICPPAQVTCKVSNVNVTLDDVRAKSINVITQNCGSSAAPLHKKTNTSTVLGMSSRQATSLFVLVGLMLVIVGVAVFFGVRARNAAGKAKSTLDRAAKESLAASGPSSTGSR